MASIVEVWGSPFSKPQALNSKPGEQRVYKNPGERTQAAVFKHRKTIDDLSRTLPIVSSDEEADKNYTPYKTKVREEMTNYAYSPPAFDHDLKLNRILHMIEQNKTGYETASTHDMLLYVFTGIFFIFTFDTFVSLGKRMR